MKKEIMVCKKQWILWVLAIATLFGACNHLKETQSNKGKESHPLLLISFDGFRYDYLSKTDTPHFDQLVRNGVKSEGLIPIFPTKTFPNHYTIATGLYPENSGLVANNMIDPETGDRFSIGNRDAVENPTWYQGEPIWNTVEKQGKKAGTMFWVGSEAPIQNMRPTHWKRYDEALPDSARIDTVVQWLSRDDEKQVDFATLYFSFTDTQGHRFGPDSQEIIEAISRADDLIGYLSEQLRARQLYQKTNIMIVSDHGMAEVSRSRIVILDDIVNPDHLEIIEHSPSIMMNVKNDKLQEVYRSLKANENHFKVFLRDEIPDRYHLKNHSRIPQLLLVAEKGYTVNTRAFFNEHPGYPSGGTHGFDNQREEMHALFAAHGPAFKKGFQMEKFENIHLYELMAHLLNVQPAPNDGSLDSLRQLFR